MQINGGLHVKDDAFFDRSIRIQDITLVPPPGGPGIQPRNRSLNQIILSLQEKITLLEQRIVQLEK
jgi:hypothetical protein